MNKVLPVSLVFAILWSLAVKAEQDETILPPTAPYFNAMEDNTSWTVTISPSENKPAMPKGSRIIDSYITTKSGPVHQTICTWTDGSKSKSWTIEGLKLETLPSDEKLLVTPFYNQHNPQRADFPDLSWINISGYRGINSWNGRKVYKFTTTIRYGEKDSFNMDYVAYIDVFTKRPLAWDEGEFHYEITSITKVPWLKLPTDVERQIKAYQQDAALPNSYKKK